MQLTALLEPAEEGGYTSQIKEIPGVISEGETKQEALSNLVDALATYLAWKAEQELEAGRERPVGKNAVELQIA